LTYSDQLGVDCSMSALRRGWGGGWRLEVGGWCGGGGVGEEEVGVRAEDEPAGGRAALLTQGWLQGGRIGDTTLRTALCTWTGRRPGA
jgi:hypothetical protein